MKNFTYGSVCSGIEAVTCAWHSFATPLWFSEIEPFPSAVLAHHFPDVPNLGDMTALADKILNREIPAPDVLVGGTPCQAFSVAGNRESLDDERGNLTLKFIEIANAIDHIRHADNKPPLIIVWENVPGVLSTKDNAFGCFLAGLASGGEPFLPPDNKRWGNAGYINAQRTVVWRTLDAQFFGVPQRRKRVFVVASARKRSACEILFERKSLPRNITTSAETQQNVTAFAETGFGKYTEQPVADTLRASGGSCGNGSESLVLSSQKSVAGTILANCGDKQWLGNQEAFSGDFFIVHGTQDPIASNKAHCLGRNNGQENVLFEMKGLESVRLHHNGISPTLKARMGTGGGNIPCVAIAGNIINRADNAGGNGVGADDSGVMYTLTSTDIHAVSTNTAVRKLTVTECERLQGFYGVTMANLTAMTKDEFIAYNIHIGKIIVNTEKGVVYTTKGPGGIPLKTPKALKGSVLNGYLVVSIKIGVVKRQCRIHRIIWIAQNGIIPRGKVIDHINNNKQDNRIENLQLLSPQENSTKAFKDGCYKIKSKLNPIYHPIICAEYNSTGITMRELANKYAISKSRIAQIIKHCDYTRIPYRKKPAEDCPDSPRYKAIGNSMAVPVMRWIGDRISSYISK